MIMLTKSAKKRQHPPKKNWQGSKTKKRVKLIKSISICSFKIKKKNLRPSLHVDYLTQRKAKLK